MFLFTLIHEINYVCFEQCDHLPTNTTFILIFCLTLNKIIHQQENTKTKLNDSSIKTLNS